MTYAPIRRDESLDVADSFRRGSDFLGVYRAGDFRVTDGANTVPVTYTGSLPDLFREGQGVVAEGMLRSDGTFRASNVLAKHDENYMPPEVAEALKKSGHWQETSGKKGASR